MSNLPWMLIALAGASFFAVLAAAFTVTGEAGIERLAEKFPRRAARIRAAAGRWDRIRSALLLASVLLALLAIVPVLRWTDGGGALSAWAVILAAAPILVVLLHIWPHVLSESYADRISVAFLPAAAAMAVVALPVAGPLAALERRLLRSWLARSDARDRPTPEDEIISLVDQTDGHDLEVEEREIIRSVFEFGSTVVREIMTPRVRMTAFEAATPIAEALPVIRESGYSRYPVFRERVDRVIGIAHARDLLLAATEGPVETPVRDRVQKISFVPETMPISDLLKLLRTRRQHLAMVVDEYGGTAGLVTMEDVLEELIGEIRDEFDGDEVDLAPPAGNAGVFDASIPVDTLNETMGLTLPDADHYDSIGGYLVSELGHIPPKGAVLQKPDFRITVEDADERRVRRVRVERAPPTDPAP